MFNKEWKKLVGLLALFLAMFFLPVGVARFDNAVMEAFYLAKEYARLHVVLCLLPAFFIAGAISVFLSQNAVMKYLGKKANKFVAYSVASVSGAILAVCSCTILPLFTGIYKRGAGLGPATAFLYSGPAINILAIVMTARVLGIKIGIARAVGAILFSVIIGLLMEFIFRNDTERMDGDIVLGEDENAGMAKNILLMIAMVGILVFANWARPATTQGLWAMIFSMKWIATSFFAIMMGIVLSVYYKVNYIKVVLSAAILAGVSFFLPNPILIVALGVGLLSIMLSTTDDGTKDWLESTWGYAKQIIPLLFIGVFIAGFLLGRPESEGIIPSSWIISLVGGNSIWSNFFASISGAFMYFATLTEVPILQGLINNGMGQGPALALLLAGPALSLPNMLVIRGVMGTKKTVVYVSLVVVMATISGMLFGAMY